MQTVAVFVGTDALELFEGAGEVAVVGVADKLGNVADLQARVGQQLLGLLDADGVEKVIEVFPRVLVEKLGQVPLGDVAFAGDLL